MITELRKQYDVDDRAVDPAQPIPDKYDVLLAVQPSLLGPQEMDHFVDAVRAGTPVAILEDPHPHFFPASVAGTAEQSARRAWAACLAAGSRCPREDIGQLWKTLGIKFDPMEVVWQDYTPEATVRGFADPQWVFLDSDNGAQDPLNSR